MNKKKSIAMKRNWKNPKYLEKMRERNKKNSERMIKERQNPFSIYTKHGHYNSFWKGDKASYSGIHSWLRKYKYNFGFCETCGKIKERLYIANIKNHKFVSLKEHYYSRDMNDYQWLCGYCHKKLDNCNRKKTYLKRLVT